MRLTTRPERRDVLSRKKNNRKTPEPILRLLQTSRKIPASAVVPQRDSSILRACSLMLNKVWVALSSRRRKKRNLYEQLANTIVEIENGAREVNEKLSALKDRIQNQDGVRKSHERK